MKNERSGALPTDLPPNKQLQRAVRRRYSLPRGAIRSYGSGAMPVLACPDAVDLVRVGSS